MTAAKDLGTEAWFRARFERISAWMIEHGAPLLVENLAPGATRERLDHAEVELGVALPPQLRALWSVHEGQRDEGNGFVEAYDLLSVAGARAEQETVRLLLELEREHPSRDAEYTVNELSSDDWIPFAGRDSDSLVVHAVTGRVFEYCHDDSPKLLAPSLADWMERYAARVEADDYSVEEGFGDYYLQLRDRERERRQVDDARRKAEHERYRRETPILEQFAIALEKRDADRCLEVLKDALASGERAAFDAAVARLFATNPEPDFAAAALRPSLSSVTLTPDQWLDVAVGGALLENNSIRNYATARCTGASDVRLARLASSVTTADPKRRAVLRRVLEDVRNRAPQSESRGWLSRLFGKPRPKA